MITPNSARRRYTPANAVSTSKSGEFRRTKCRTDEEAVKTYDEHGESHDRREIANQRADNRNKRSEQTKAHETSRKIQSSHVEMEEETQADDR